MIIGSEDRAQGNNKNEPVRVLDTYAQHTRCRVDLNSSVAEAIERQVGKMLENDIDYLRGVEIGDFAKARGLENMDRLIAREPVYAAMVCVKMSTVLIGEVAIFNYPLDFI